MFLSREAILAAESDMPRETVPVPEWSGDVLVFGLSGAEQDSFEASRRITVDGKETQSLVNFRAALCVRCIRNEDGSRVFTDADAVALGAKSSKAIARIFPVAAKLSGMTKEDVEKLEKN